MKRLAASVSSRVDASTAQCFRVLSHVEAYPQWYPEGVREVQVLERDGEGRARTLRARLHAALGRLAHDFHLLLAVQCDPPDSVRLRRIPHDPSDPERFEARWGIHGGSPTTLALELEAELEVPRLLPVGQLGEVISGRLLAAAVRELSSRPITSAINS